MTATRFGLPIILALAVAGLIVAAVWLWSPARSAPSDQTATDQLALKRVMLSTGGVAYFEFEARVDTDAVFSLPVRMDQADDVLKSVVVFDTLGQAGTIQLPSRAPLSDIFRGLPFGPDALQSSAALLEALRGAEIEVSGTASAAGRVVAIDEETAQGPDGLAITRHRVSVMTADGLRQFVLEEAVTIKFRDPLLQAQIDSALKSLAEHREGQSRTLTIRNIGNKSRIVTVGFVASAPLWKASYRLTTAPDNAKAWLQGWAVLENVSGVDWDNVELTVVTGNPVTFRQALYQTYYVDRPEVPVEVLGRILPRADEGAISAEERPRRAAKALAPRAVPAPPPPPPAPMMPAESEPFAGGSAADQPSFDQLTAGGAVSQTKEAATQVRFTLPGKVTVRNGQSLSVAIINAQVGAETISLFQPPTHPRHPLATVRVVNDTGASLPPGVVTLYERDKAGLASFVGDARLSTLPKGESRLLSFSLDQKIIVDAARKFEQTVSKVSLANGVLKASAVDVEETAYTLKSEDDLDRKLVLEHPRRPGWTITTPDAKSVEMTETVFRIPAALKAKETQTLKVVTEWTREDTIVLVDLPAEQFLVYARNARLTEAQRAAFNRMAELKREMDQTDQQLQTENSARERVFEEQNRVRENIKAAPDKSDLQARYLRSMNKLEDEADQRKRAIDGLEAKRASQLAALNAYIATLNF